MQFTPVIQKAAQLWHDRIGRHLCTQPWDKSMGAGYTGYNFKKKALVPTLLTQRLGVCGTSVIMIDPNSAVLVDRIDLTKIQKPSPDANFKYGESELGVHNVNKSQINWALDEARTFPMLLVRPGLASAMNSLVLSQTDDQIIVCVPNASFSFERHKVRRARDFILAANLQTKWRKAALLRQTIGLGEHLGSHRENAMMTEHGAMLELFPLDVWLPEVGSGNEIALGDCLAAKPGVDIDAMPYASALLGKQPVKQTVETVEIGVTQ